jgi:hypothetical protein
VLGVALGVALGMLGGCAGTAATAVPPAAMLDLDVIFVATDMEVVHARTPRRWVRATSSTISAAATAASW